MKSKEQQATELLKSRDSAEHMSTSNEFTELAACAKLW